METLQSEKVKGENLDIVESSIGNESLISFLTEVPAPIQKVMEAFIETHPNWDQYRLIQAALSGFLLQNGIESRAVNQIYYKNMFAKQSLGKHL